MKSYYIRDEYTKVRSIGSNELLDEPLLLFRWAKIDKNKYIVITPKIFRKQVGDVLTVMTSKQIMKYFNQLNLEAK